MEEHKPGTGMFHLFSASVYTYSEVAVYSLAPIICDVFSYLILQLFRP